MIKRPVGFGETLTVNFPDGSTKNAAKYGVVSFEHHRKLYEIR